MMNVRTRELQDLPSHSNDPYQVWRPRKGVSLPAPGLTVAEDRGGEAVHPHVD